MIDKIEEEDIPSPCIEMCIWDEKTQLCKGCFRTIDEIMNWEKYTNDDKAAVLKFLTKREQTFTASHKSY